MLIKKERKPGDTVKLKVRRGEETPELELKLDRNPDYKPPRKRRQLPKPPKKP